MANETNENKNQEPQAINEQNLTVEKTPWWKWPLKIGGYILAGAAGLLAGLALGGHGGDDEDDAPAEGPQE